MNFWRRWLVSARPFSFSASIIPVLFGAILAMTVMNQPLHLMPLFLSVLAMTSLHAGANILNDICDYKSGLDKIVTPVSGGVVRGLITTHQAWRAVFLLLGVGIILGTYLALTCTLNLLWVGIPGILIGFFYSQGQSRSFKYQSLGDLAVFLGFGSLGALGSWLVQAHTFSWLPIIWSTPISLLVIGIVHANNWRDISSDRLGGVKTIANRLGDRGSFIYYSFLIFAPFVIVVFLVAVPGLLNKTAVPPSGLFTLACLPMAVRLFTRAKRRHSSNQPLNFLALDGATAQLNLVFGALYTLSLLFGHYL